MYILLSNIDDDSVYEFVEITPELQACLHGATMFCKITCVLYTSLTYSIS